MFNLYGKNDADLCTDVMDELKWNPSTKVEDINVTVVDGIVTLRGRVSSYAKKGAAEKAARCIGGVRAIADELEVQILGPNQRTDESIAKAALQALEWNSEIPQDLGVTVDQGWVTLQGEADSEPERRAAKRVVSEMTGVKGVTSDIQLRAKDVSSDLQLTIENAIKRNSFSKEKRVSVSVIGDSVMLSGKANSFAEIERAKEAAWNAPGVKDVISEIAIAH